jgi:hypothetical protein
VTHSHIARPIDAGVSANGQPYLVLEHVNGQRIDRYYDQFLDQFAVAIGEYDAPCGVTSR